MSRIASGTDYGNARRQLVPIVSTLAACLLDILPVVANRPLVPDFAFLMLIAWRLLRPEIWSAQIALAFGLFNDLVAGHPLGQSMALWTAIFLLFDLAESRSGWRDYWTDWLFAGFAILLYAAGQWYVARMMDSRIDFVLLAPQILLALLSYPLVARIVLSLDRWRLSR